MRRAFSMIELTFAIVIIGVLAGIAIPKFAATRDDAMTSRARSVVGAVRSALAAERQKRILRGDFNTALLTPSSTNPRVFVIRTSSSEVNLTDYPVTKCQGSSAGKNCWRRAANDTFIYYGPGSSFCIFKINSRFQLVKQAGCDVPGLKNL